MIWVQTRSCLFAPSVADGSMAASVGGEYWGFLVLVELEVISQLDPLTYLLET